LTRYHTAVEHSIAAKYAARPAARFPRPSSRTRERRLGLRAATAFRAAGWRPTVLRQPELSALAQLRAGSRSITPTPTRRAATGRPRPIVSMTWSRSVARLRSATATSAGGIVVRVEGGRPSLVAGLRRREGDRHGGTWTLPKGTPNPGETVEETAVREVEEETGLRVRIVAPLPSIEYAFVQGGVRIHKTVHYFLMEPVGGDLARHDHEFERVRWVRFEDARSLLTFETERALVETAAGTLGASGVVTPPVIAPLGREAAAG